MRSESCTASGEFGKVATYYCLEDQESLFSTRPTGSHPLQVEYLNTTALRSRGWSHGMIRAYLPQPDKLVRNPHVQTGRRMKMYRLDRVMEAESRPNFALHRLNSGARSQCAANCYQAKAKALTDLARQIPIEVPNLSIQDLESQSTSPFNNDPIEQHKCELLFLMEQCKASEWTLDDFFWHPGIRAARVIVRRRILVSVMEKYPHLNEAALSVAKNLNGYSENLFF